MFNPDADNPYGQPSLPYEPYKGHTTSLPFQQQVFESQPTTPRASSPHIPPHRTTRSAEARSTSPRLSKVEALAFVGKCKRWLIAGSIVAFGILGGLVAGHVVGSTSNQVPPADQAAPASNAPIAPTPSSSSGGGYFQQQQGGFGFGNGNSGQPPVSSSHTS